MRERLSWFKSSYSGTQGDVVNVLNPQSKRTITGIVTGRGQVTIEVAKPTPVYVSDTSAIPANGAGAPVALADGSSSQVTPKPE